MGDCSELCPTYKTYYSLARVIDPFTYLENMVAKDI